MTDDALVLTLTYGPAMTRYAIPDPMLLRSLQKFLSVKNPNYGLEHPNEPEFITFFDAEAKMTLTGLRPALEQWAKKNDLQVHLVGFPEPKKVPVLKADMVQGITLEDYQLDAIQSCLKNERGVVEISVGGGKTEIAIGMVLALRKPRTLYVVPDIQGMNEIYARFKLRGFRKNILGRLGDTHEDTKRRIVIACIASLYSGLKRSTPGVLELLQNAEVLILDEVHHQGTALSWQVVAGACEARYRIGMSGTPYKDPRSRFNPSFIHPFDSWLTGYTGPTLIHMPPAKLQEMGKLTRCEIHPFIGGGPTVYEMDWASVYNEGIIHNDIRNRRIATLVSNLVDGGARPLISVEKLEHGRILQRMLLEEGIVAACSYGQGVLIVPGCILPQLPKGIEVTPVPVTDPETHRKREAKEVVEDDFVHIPATTSVKGMLLSGVIHTIIGSRIYDECVDVPCLTDLINAAGGKASQRYRQKIGRILRLFRGKAVARIWDPFDECHPFLRRHSALRLGIARSEGYEIIQGPSIECKIGRAHV